MRYILVQTAKVAAGVALLVWLLIAVDIHEIVSLLRRCSPSWIAAGMVAYTAAALVIVFRLQVVFSDFHLPFAAAARFTMAGYFFNQLLPSGVGGDVYRSLRLRPLAGSWPSVIAKLVFERTSGALALLLPGAVLLLSSNGLGRVALEANRRVPGGKHSHWAAAALVLLGALVGLGTILRRGRLARGIGDFLTALRSLRSGNISAVLGTSALHHALRICGSAAFFEAIGLHVPLRQLTICMAFTLLASLVPITVGALGLREGIFAYSLSLYGVPTVAGLAVAMLNRAVTVLFGIVGGLMFYTEPRARW